MPRVHLSLEESLFNLLEDEAKELNISVNVHIVALLNKLKNPNTVDYAILLSETVKEALEFPIDKEFTLVELKTFSEISMMHATMENIKPSMVRAVVGKMFNAEVRKGAIDKIKRVYNEDGKPKFNNKAAVYIHVV